MTYEHLLLDWLELVDVVLFCGEGAISELNRLLAAALVGLGEDCLDC